MGQPADPTLQAYKGWILGTIAAMGGDVKSANDLTESEWEKEWRAFWAKQKAP